jgi:RNA polymerase sigma-70 factor (ECF subfamily)
MLSSPVPAPDDEALMARVLAGEQAAFALLVERHLPRAYAIARRVLSQQADAEDAAQEAFTRLWTHAYQWQAGRGSFTTWFYRIVVNASLDHARRQRGRREHLDGEALLAELLDPQADLHSCAAQAREAAALHSAVQRLPAQQRMAVVLCYLEEHSNPQAAQLMGLHLKALEGLLGRARKQLRGWLGRLQQEEDL